MMKNHLKCQTPNLVSHFFSFIATPVRLHYSIIHLFLVLVSKNAQCNPFIFGQKQNSLENNQVCISYCIK